MGRKKKLENQADVIIQTARLLFAENGYSKTTLDDIARKVGIGKATLYTDFSSKEEIFVEVVRGNQQFALQQMQESIQNSTLKPLQTLYTVLLQDMLYALGNIQRLFPFTDPLEAIHQEHERRTVVPRALIREFVEKKIAMMSVLLEEAARQNQIQPVDDYLALMRLIRMGLLGAKQHILRNHPDMAQPEVTKVVSELILLLLSGVVHPLDETFQSSIS